MKNYVLLASYFVIFSLVGVQSSFCQLPNIRGIDPQLTTTGDPGDVTLKVILENDGDTTFIGGLNNIYVSLDTLLNPAEDSSIFIFSMPLVEKADTANYELTLPFCDNVVISHLPSYVLNGSPFYILFGLDYGNVNVESNESDNVVVFKPSLVESCTLGIYEVVSNQLNIYPNPGSGVFTLTLPPYLGTDAIVTVQNVINNTGITLNGLKNASPKTFDISFLPSGIYLLSVQSHDQYLQKKILIEK
jgi:hypothetical protein